MVKSTRNGMEKSPPGGGGGGGGAILTRFHCVGKLLYGKTKGIRSSKSKVSVIWSFYTVFLPVWGPSLLSSKSKEVISKEAWYIIIMQKSLFLCML